MHHVMSIALFVGAEVGAVGLVMLAMAGIARRSRR